MELTKLHLFVNRASSEEYRALVQAKTYILRFAWRFTRGLLKIKGILEDAQRLDSVLMNREDDIDPWNSNEGIPLFRTYSNRSVRAKVISLVLDEEPHIGVAPPPEAFDADGTSLFIPQYDSGLDRWLRIFEVISNHLSFDINSEKDPEQDIGLIALRDPNLVRKVWPTKMEVVRLEDRIVEQIGKVWIKKGSTKSAADYIYSNYAIRGKEAKALLDLVQNDIAEQQRMDTEQARTLLTAHLEDLLERSKEAMDLRVEQRTLANLAQVRGITRTDPQDSVKDFIDAVSRVSRKDSSKKVLDATTVKELDAPRD